MRLAESANGHAVTEVIDAQVESADFRLLCATIMPDHVHLLIALGDRLSLSQTIGKFKALTSRILCLGVSAGRRTSLSGDLDRKMLLILLPCTFS
jgi:REP element-mobilizing transposase RayT